MKNLKTQRAQRKAPENGEKGIPFASGALRIFRSSGIFFAIFALTLRALRFGFPETLDTHERSAVRRKVLARKKLAAKEDLNV